MIGEEGARALSKALKTNTTLTTLDLRSVQHQQQGKTKPKIEHPPQYQADNGISDVAESVQCDVLMLNTSLISLEI